MGHSKGLKFSKPILSGIFILSFLILVTSFVYAQTNSESNLIAPEPGSIVLLSTGICGWLIRFARRRFEDFKRFFDIFVSSFGLVIAAPVIALTGLVIKTVSPGPIFFKQERVGLNGKLFDIYKLRTMKLDAEKETGPVWAQEDDPRLIRFGKIIRKMHLDELPQLWNVLNGDMSIVGPRPERQVFVKELSGKIADYPKRLRVKPGITGLAQVVHKYDETIEDVKKKVKFDLLYIREMCLMVDVRILLWTIVVAAVGKGAR